MIKSITIGLTGHVARVRERRRAYRALVVKAEGREHLEDPGAEKEDNIKMDFQEVEWGHGKN